MRTLNDEGDACIVTPDERSLGVICGAGRANAVRIKMQNRTNSRSMRLWWQVEGNSPEWNRKNSVALDVRPMDDSDTVYEAAIPLEGVIKQLRLSFSDGGERVAGTLRIDYIWLGNSPTAARK